jgi:hypothetical protein
MIEPEMIIGTALGLSYCIAWKLGEYAGKMKERELWNTRLAPKIKEE